MIPEWIKAQAESYARFERATWPVSLRERVKDAIEAAWLAGYYAAKKEQDDAKRNDD